MKHYKLLIPLAIASFIQPVVANEQTMTRNEVDLNNSKGWYLTLSSGAILPYTSDISFTLTDSENIPTTGSHDQKLSTATEGGIGYDFGKIRAEITYNYSPLSGKTLRAKNDYTNASASLNSKSKIQSILFGLDYDFRVNKKWIPYIGGAIGPGLVDISSYKSLIDGDQYIMDPKSSTAFAYQIKSGVSYSASNNTKLFIEVAHLGISETHLTILQGPDPGTTASNYSIHSHSGALVKLGIRRNF